MNCRNWWSIQHSFVRRICDAGQSSAPSHPPIKQRTMLVVGGFPYDTEKGRDLREAARDFSNGNLESRNGGHLEKLDQLER